MHVVVLALAGAPALCFHECGFNRDQLSDKVANPD
jgi:hypothetical protein